MLTIYIALVCQSYEKFYGQTVMYQYKTKARLNVESYQIMEVVQNLPTYKLLFFSMDKEMKSQEKEQYLGTC